VSSASSGIKSFGAYIPKRRMPRSVIAAAHAWSFPSLKGLAKGERSMCSWDEDVITMAVEAGRDCMQGYQSAITSVSLASTSAPYDDLNHSVFVASALRLSETISGRDLAGSTRVGLTSVIDACRAGDAGDRLVLASEKRIAKPGSAQEMQYGCGAAALAIGEGSDLIARFLGSESVSVPFFDHFRKADREFDYVWEERWIRDEGVSKLVPRAIKGLMDSLQLSAERIAWFGLAGGPNGSDKLVAKLLEIAPEKVLPDLQAQVGETGAAHSPLLLISALECAKPGDIIVIASFAQGCEVIAFEMLREAPKTARRGLAGSISNRIEESAYMKLLSFDGHVQLDWGMRTEVDNKTAMTQLYRSADQILGFVGGCCTECSTVQFPRLPACVNCGAVDAQQPYPLAGERAQIATYTADWLQYSPSPPLYMGLVQFDCGARVLMEIVDVAAGAIDVGTALTMSFRIKERDRLRGYDRYFWKAAPAMPAAV
jgi:3-hydroxy-3-methylglutaryl CoA synthase